MTRKRAQLAAVSLEPDILVLSNVVMSGDYLVLPSGTYSQRPGTPANGMIRFNTSNNYIEYYSINAWYRFLKTTN